MTALALIATVSLLYMLVVSVHNWRAFPRLSTSDIHAAPGTPPISVLIPARDEERNIGQTLDSLLRSSYPTFEVVILDDGSTDHTGELARRIAQNHAHVRVVVGEPLPQGWLGKNWACWQLSQLASYDLFLFADADVRWTPQALAALAGHQHVSAADLLAAWPTQYTCSWGERLTVPMMAFTLLGYLPAAWAHDADKIQAAAANGQCLLFRRQAYQQIGGHAAVRHSAIEDVALARRIKAQGLRLRMVDAAGYVSCRMYNGLRQAIDGYTKNILAGHADSVALLLLSTLHHLLVFISPWLWLASGQQPGWPLWPLLLIAAAYTVRAITASVARLPMRDIWLLPLAVLLASVIALRAACYRLCLGGPQWKGRPISSQREVPRAGAR